MKFERHAAFMRFRSAALAAIWAIQSLIAAAFASELALPPGGEGTIYEVGYAHLDTQWRWSYPQVIRQFLPDTMWDNFYLFRKYPHYVFNFTGANRYRMMKEYWPDGYERVRQYVKQGRWFPAGGSWEENDTLVPSTESLIRQILYGQRFFEKEFGVRNNEYMLPDCFGFPASLPSVLAHCGVRGFCTQKLTWHSAVGIPFNVGRWEGPDGQSVVAVFNPGAYDAALDEDPGLSATNRARLELNRAQSGLSSDFRFYGVGDRGGAPSENSVRLLENSLSATGSVRVLSATADQFFTDITDEQRSKLPVYKGDLLLIEHSAGSLTSQAYMKRWNRKNELLAEAAEKASVAAHLLGTGSYPRQKLTRAWELVLGAQFHDILPGTCLPKAYEYSWNDEVIAMNSFASVLQDGVGGVARELDTRTDGLPLVVYNPLSIEREDVVEAELTLPPNLVPPQVCLPDGTPLPTQILSSNGSTVRVLFLAHVPSIGFSVFAVRAANAAQPRGAMLVADDRRLENDRYRVTLDDAGDLASLFDKRLGKELLASPARLAFLNEKPSAYPAWNMDWKDRQLPPRGYVRDRADLSLVENGPVRVAIQVKRQSENSVFKQTYRLAAGPAGDTLEIANEIDWQSAGCSLKAEFPLSVSNSLATYNWQLGKVQRGNNEPMKYEVPSHQWFDLTDSNGSYGVSILSGAKYGSDKPDDHTLRLTLLYTPEIGDNYTEQRYQDWGHHEFIYAVASHAGDWRAGRSDWQAARLEQPLLAFKTVPHPGHLGPSFSLLTTSSDHVTVQAVKLAEDNDRVIVRLQELDGQTASAVALKPAVKLQAVDNVDGVERNPVPLRLTKGTAAMDFQPYQIRTLSCAFAPPQTTNLPTSVPVDLPYDLDVFSGHDAKQDGYCDRSGYSFPGEMIDDTLVSEGIAFHIGPRTPGQDNAVVCNGQTIALPAGHYNHLYMLACSVNGDAEGDYLLGDETFHLKIQDWSGFLGSWDNRIFAGPVDALTYSIKQPLDRIAPGFIKRQQLAWFASHRHQRDGSDQPYTYCYLFKYSLPVSKDPKTLTLPNNSRIRIIAISAAWSENELTGTVQPLYDDLADRKPMELVNQQ
jgi:alpha-mannosidase